MSHRVINLQAKVTSSSQASSLKNELNSKLDSKSYDLFERSVVDGQDPDGNPTLNCKTQHNVTEEGVNFSTWLQNWMDTNKASFNKDGTVRTHGFMWVELEIHDCYHSVDGVEQPCENQHYQKYDIRP